MHDPIEEVKSKVDMISLVGEYVKLTRAGKHFKGLCPFHSEKTPSFIVSPEMQIFKCFGCGESGDCYSFLQKHEGMDFGEALQFLANRVGVTLPKRGYEVSEKDTFYKINQEAAKFYHYLLLKHMIAKDALFYMTNTRQVSHESIETFQIGFAPQNRESLKSYLLKKKHKLSDIEKSGLVVRIPAKNGKSEVVWDRFRGRVTFPLFDHRGNSIGMAGRILPQYDNGKTGKYINSPETLIYHKSQVLYGLNTTRQFIKKKGYAIVVEGELDLISLWQVGIKNVVAIKGSALTEDQLRILSRITTKLILALDSDLAGNNAARRGITVAQNLGFNIKVMVSGEYKDPDEFAKKDFIGLKKALKSSIDVWEFIIKSIIAKHDIKTGSGKASVSREVIPVISSIEDSIVQAHYVSFFANLINTSEEAIMDELKRFTNPKTSSILSPLGEKSEEKILKKTRRDLLEEELLILGFALDPWFLLEDRVSKVIVNNFFVKIIKILEKYRESNETFDLKNFTKTVPPELSEGLSNILLQEVDVNNKTRLNTQFELAIKEVGTLNKRERMHELAKLISQHEQKEEWEKVSQAEKELAEISKGL